MCNTRWKAYCIVLKNTSRPARGLLCLVPSCLCLNLRLHPCFVCISVRVCVRLSLSLSLSLCLLYPPFPSAFVTKLVFLSLSWLTPSPAQGHRRCWWQETPEYPVYLNAWLMNKTLDIQCRHTVWRH